MSKRKSRNNRRKTMGLYTTNPTQYIQLTNFDKYEHTFDEKLKHIIVTNKSTKDPKGVFDCDELLNYLEMNSFQSHANSIRYYITMKEGIYE